jgi:hypothetical protein
MIVPGYRAFGSAIKSRTIEVSIGLLLWSFTSCQVQTMPGTIDTTIKSYGEFIEYAILPEHKRVKLVSIRSRPEFESILTKYNAKKLSIDFESLKAANDSNYGFSLTRISLVTIYSLSNGLFVVDQLVNDKANPYYICESLKDFKLITKYLVIFRPEADGKLEVQCNIHAHLEIKEFLEREKERLNFVKEMSDERHKLFIAKDGKCVYISYRGKGIENEDEFYWSLVIYESMEKFKLHNAGFQDR